MGWGVEEGGEVVVAGAHEVTTGGVEDDGGRTPAR